MELTLAGKILKWLGLIAIALALLGGPVVYINTQLKSATKTGFDAGYAAAESKYQAGQLQQATRIFRQQEHEGIEAQARVKADETRQRNVLLLQDKLQKALQDNEILAQKAEADKSIPAYCVLNSDVTDILRNAAAGKFDPGLTSAFPSRSSYEVPGDVIVPRNINSTVAPTSGSILPSS